MATKFESTPCVVIDLGKRYKVRITWTLHGGMYGPQCKSEAWDIQAEDWRSYPKAQTTGGCGYNKEGAALDNAFRAIGVMPRGWDPGCTGPAPHEFHKGGNYYYVPERHVLKFRR